MQSDKKNLDLKLDKGVWTTKKESKDETLKIT